ncbi:hypothetical protein M406DRAFT_331441 [Cryphonectria parasitica EP155]|uniref:Uncharacterized protein n=1 Tax=Cryphonectria parasitica (strain ATCC 38755 / EP155) TaxID=660469 RepID=A0A9P4Y237_CRYP1|nr:uncharacterized protein M406DRAFT_331441 [Cryphonectria parasitica EP155]KAF3765131.1 hypothetical protein M406DRAFT_331441 [Cryphonectria parasitica EP155]
MLASLFGYVNTALHGRVRRDFLVETDDQDGLQDRVPKASTETQIDQTIYPSVDHLANVVRNQISGPKSRDTGPTSLHDCGGRLASDQLINQTQWFKIPRHPWEEDTQYSTIPKLKTDRKRHHCLL